MEPPLDAPCILGPVIRLNGAKPPASSWPNLEVGSNGPPNVLFPLQVASTAWIWAYCDSERSLNIAPNHPSPAAPNGQSALGHKPSAATGVANPCCKLKTKRRKSDSQVHRTSHAPIRIHNGNCGKTVHITGCFEGIAFLAAGNLFSETSR